MWRTGERLLLLDPGNMAGALGSWILSPGRLRKGQKEAGWNTYRCCAAIV